MGANLNSAHQGHDRGRGLQGPSLIIAYAPCINHGIKMDMAQAEIKKAVACGYWTMYRYNPELAEQGKNPLIVDRKGSDRKLSGLHPRRGSLRLSGEAVPGQG